MKKKNLLYSILAFAVVLAVYCIIFLAIPFPKPASSWLSFGFTLLAIFLCGAIFPYAFRGNNLKSKLYGFPIFKIALIYAAVQFIVGIVICVIGAFVNVPIWIPTILYVIFFAVGTLGFLATDSAKNTIEEVEASTESKTQTFTKLRVEMDGITDLCTDEGTCIILKELAEKFRYSDPVSCQESESMENDLLTKTKRLRDLVKDRNYVSAVALTDEIKICLSERNRICKMYKK